MVDDKIGRTIKRYSCLLIGIMFLWFAFVRLRTIWTFKSDLTEIKGKPAYVNTNVKTVTDGRGRKSQFSECYFAVEGYDKAFRFQQNIGDEYYDKEYAKIASCIKQADTISVFMKERAETEWPEVFQIMADGNICFSYDKHVAAMKPDAAFLLVFGIGFSVLAYYVGKPKNT